MAEGGSSHINDYLSRLEVDEDDGSNTVDKWETDELLFLASSVQRSGRKWEYISSLIKEFGERSRPSEWFTPKNCAIQYMKLFKKIEEDSKKKSLPRRGRKTLEAMLVKNLTEKRFSELHWLNQQTKASRESDILEEEDYNQYVSKRDDLIRKKKLNKSLCRKGTKDLKKKKSLFQDPSYESLPQSPLEDSTPIKKKKEDEDNEIKADVKKRSPAT